MVVVVVVVVVNGDGGGGGGGTLDDMGTNDYFTGGSQVSLGPVVVLTRLQLPTTPLQPVVFPPSSPPVKRYPRRHKGVMVAVAVVALVVVVLVVELRTRCTAICYLSENSLISSWRQRECSESCSFCTCTWRVTTRVEVVVVVVVVVIALRHSNHVNHDQTLHINKVSGRHQQVDGGSCHGNYRNK